MVKNVTDFGGAEIRVHAKTRLGLDEFRFIFPSIAKFLGLFGLPNNGRGNRSSGRFFPNDRGFALVGNANASHFIHRGVS